MDIIFLEKFIIDAIFPADRTDVADARHGGFLHHVSQLAGEEKLSFSGHDVDLDLQGIAAHAGPGQAPDDSDVIGVVQAVDRVALLAEIILKAGLGDFDASLAFLQKLPRRFPADLADLPLQASHTGFPGVGGNQFLHSLVRDGKIIAGEAVFLDLFL